MQQPGSFSASYKEGQVQIEQACAWHEFTSTASSQHYCVLPPGSITHQGNEMHERLAGIRIKTLSVSNLANPVLPRKISSDNVFHKRQWKSCTGRVSLTNGLLRCSIRLIRGLRDPNTSDTSYSPNAAYLLIKPYEPSS